MWFIQSTKKINTIEKKQIWWAGFRWNIQTLCKLLSSDFLDIMKHTSEIGRNMSCRLTLPCITGVFFSYTFSCGFSVMGCSDNPVIRLCYTFFYSSANFLFDDERVPQQRKVNPPPLYNALWSWCLCRNQETRIILFYNTKGVVDVFDQMAYENTRNRPLSWTKPE